MTLLWFLGQKCKNTRLRHEALVKSVLFACFGSVFEAIYKQSGAPALARTTRLKTCPPPGCTRFTAIQFRSQFQVTKSRLSGTPKPQTWNTRLDRNTIYENTEASKRDNKLSKSGPKAAPQKVPKRLNRSSLHSLCWDGCPTSPTGPPKPHKCV